MTRILLPLACIAVVARLASAQAPQAPQAGTPLQVKLLPPAAPVDGNSVWAQPAGATVKGTLQSWSDTLIVVEGAHDRRLAVRLSEVDWISAADGRVPRTQSTTMGAVIGAAAGPLAVLFYTSRNYLFNAPAVEHAPIRPYQLGVCIGAALGAMIGYHWPPTHWVRIYSRVDTVPAVPGT